MGHYNYRVLAKPYFGEMLYSIHEVYYDDHANVQGWTEASFNPTSDSMEGLKRIVGNVIVALDAPVIKLNADWSAVDAEST